MSMIWAVLGFTFACHDGHFSTSLLKKLGYPLTVLAEIDVSLPALVCAELGY